ncbi:MAG: hypothetical protein JO040_02140 [Gemmatimonadetes bacterium]|nr:hypothetical protein [Gemmatimonadota bacterium]
MKRTSLHRRLGVALPALVLLAGAAGCDSLLDVDRKDLILPGDLQGDPNAAQALVNASESQYKRAFNWVANSGAAATDEAIFAHGWSPWEDYDERDLSGVGCPHDCIGYGYMASARTTSRNNAVAAKGTGALEARAWAYAGYSTLLLADYQCQVAIGGKLVSRDEAYDTAIAYLKQAVDLATAARNDTLVNLANVGIARAYLNRWNLNEAISYARKVDPQFKAWVRFSSSPNWDDWVNVYNLYNRTSGLRDPNEFNLALDPKDWSAARTDLRLPYDPSPRRMFTSKPEGRVGLLPYTPYSFEGWTPGNTTRIRDDADIMFASGLEAQHILAEASLWGGSGGWSQGEVLSFLNARRAVGGHGPFTGSDLKGEERAQRMMDLYFAGYRLPDLLRYQAHHGVDLWPRGAMGGYPDGVPYRYGGVTCWPVGQSEGMS